LIEGIQTLKQRIMPYFNARPSSSSSNNTRAAAIASRYGKAVKDSQVHNTIRDKSEQPQNVTKAQFYPTSANNKNHHFDPYNSRNQNNNNTQEFVKYYPKAPSFQQQIEAAEQKAHQLEAKAKAEQSARRDAPPQPIPRDDPTIISGNELGDTTYSKTEYHRKQEQSVNNRGPFAANVYNSPPRQTSQQQQQNSGALVVLSEYQDQFSQGRAATARGANTLYSPRRVPVNKEIEILLQRRGLGYEYQNQKTAFEKYQERIPGGVPVTWQKPKKSQPEVVLTMTTNTSSSAPAITARPASAGPRRNSNGGNSSTLQNSTFTHHQQTHIDRPSTASSHSAQNKNARQQKFPPRTGLTLYERAKQERAASESRQQQKRPASTLGVRGSNAAPVQNTSRPASASRRRAADGSKEGSKDLFEAQPPHYLSPTRQGNHTDKYHRDCNISPKQLRHQQEKAQRQLSSQQARCSQQQQQQPLPSTSRFDTMFISEHNPEVIDFYSCGCPCHAVSHHDDIIAKTMYRRVENRRMLRTVKNYQSGSITTTGVGACLKWENLENDDEKKKEYSTSYQRTPKTYQERLEQQKVQQEQQQKLKAQQDAIAQAKKAAQQQQQQQAAAASSENKVEAKQE
jgi:hypothetical protein